MPCSSGETCLPPSSNSISISSLPGLISGSAFKRVKDDLDEVTSILCGLCTSIEESENNYFRNDPILREWWEHHKEEDIRQKKEEQEKYDAALANALNARKLQRRYIKYLLDEFLTPEDKDYFNSNLRKLQVEIDEALGNFPEMLKDLGPNISV